MALPTFRLVTVHEAPLADGSELEETWMVRAARTGSPEAHVWTAPRGLVVPRSYERLAAFAAACAAAREAGWRMQVRCSGGGLVPQGPGVLNVSLVWCTARGTPGGTDEIYGSLCGALAAALAHLGIIASTQRAEGSFCDGRFDLVVGGRKLAGTAQAWRRIEDQRVVLAHAVLIASADPVALAAIANRFEDFVASGRIYRAEAVTSVAQALRDAHPGREAPADLDTVLAAALARQLADAG
ncbi:MAG TPA: lipoate--protein ligase [Burkholderiaceae bacterium]|nr:lipoate--protein ligase [Burkholderiaceae bacterium]